MNPLWTILFPAIVVVAVALLGFVWKLSTEVTKLHAMVKPMHDWWLERFGPPKA